VRKSPQPPLKLLPSGLKPLIGIGSLPKNDHSLSELRSGINDVHKVSQLNPEQQNLFNFVKLIVDIKYRHRYGKQIEPQNGKGYSTYND